MTRRPYLVTLTLLLATVGLQCAASPINPRFPSTLSNEGMNGVPVPTSEADWTFEISHLDMAIASEHLAGFRARNADVYLLQYMLLNTVITNDTTTLNALQSYATANGVKAEDAFLHFSDDTSVKYADGSTETIPGWGGGTAATQAAARIKTNIYGSFRWFFNLKSPVAKGFLGSYFRTIVSTGNKPDGIFIDENSPFSSSVITPAILSGGHIVEYSNQTIAQANSTYATDQVAAYAAIKAAMGSDDALGDHYLLPNVAEYVDDFLNLGLNGGGGMVTEFYIQEISPRSPHMYDIAKQFGAAGKLLTLAQVSYAPMFTGAGNYSSDQDRHEMFGLTEYWMAKQGNTTFYSQGTSGYVPMRNWWCKAREFDVGQPIDSLYSVWQTGTDSANQNYTIYKRQYAKALMLSRPQPGWQYTNYNAPSKTYSLGGTYQLLHWDGTLGPNITSISLSMGETATLVSAVQVAPTLPVISNVTVGSISANSAVVSYSTSVPTTGAVSYGTTTSYGATVNTSALATGQSVPIPGLTAGTLYHYRVAVTDASGNAATGTDNTFTTTALPSLPQISVAISANKSSAKSGDTIVYTVSCNNLGAGAATTIAVQADVDPNVTFVSASNSGAYDSTAKVVRWSLGSLAGGASTSLTYSVTVK